MSARAAPAGAKPDLSVEISTSAPIGAALAATESGGAHARAEEAMASLRLVRAGQWGGQGISMTVRADGASVEFDCALARIDEPLVVRDDGAFEAAGAYAFEIGGPRSPDAPPLKRHPVSVTGWTDGTNMRLSVRFLKSEREIGPFELLFGQQGRMNKCV